MCLNLSGESEFLQFMADSLGPRTVSLTKCCGTAKEPDALMCTQKEKRQKKNIS